MGGSLSRGVVTANEIHIPVNQRLPLRLEAADVIHNFWIPALSRKIDMIPGRPNHLWLEADESGVFAGACSEYCGAQHAWMRFVVVAEAQDAFDAWLREQATPAAIPATDSGQRGLELFKGQTCITCHVIRGVSATGNAAPDLTHLASRRLIGAGVLANTDANLTRWLKDPQAVKPASRMPNLNLTDAQVKDLVTYLGVQN